MNSQLSNAMRLISGCVQPMQTRGYLCWPTLLLRLYVVGQPQTNCSVTSKARGPSKMASVCRCVWWPAKTTCSSTPYLGRHNSCRPERSGKKTGFRLLWSIVILYVTLLSNSLASTCRAIPGHSWTVSAQVKAHVMLTWVNGVLPHLLSVIAESNRPWNTLSTRVRSQNWMAACWVSVKQMTMLSTGWRWQRRRHSRNEICNVLHWLHSRSATRRQW